MGNTSFPRTNGLRAPAPGGCDDALPLEALIFYDCFSMGEMPVGIGRRRRGFRVEDAKRAYSMGVSAVRCTAITNHRSGRDVSRHKVTRLQRASTFVVLQNEFNELLKVLCWGPWTFPRL